MHLQVYTTDGRILAERVAKIAQLIPSMEVRFQKAVVYDDFTHFALVRETPRPRIFDSSSVSSAKKSHIPILNQQDQLPSTYTDLLIPALRDGAQGGVNIFASDFPFGPGTVGLSEDIPFKNYKLADSVRQVAAVRMATIGFDAIDEYVSAESEETEKKNLTRFGKSFNEAVENIQKDVNEDAMDRSPFDKDEGDYFKQMSEEMRNNGAFRNQVDSRIRTEDLVQALQISKTVEYVTHVMQLPAQDADVQVKTGDEINEGIGERVAALFDSLEEGGLELSDVNLADVAGNHENISCVQSDRWLVKERDELVKLYEADSEVIQQYLGYYDRFAEPRRQKLRRKLKDTWTDWRGMRRAFPSYLVTVAGELGTGLTTVLSDIYSWTAVQQIEIRNMSSNAGQQCDLSLSNMRKRIVSDVDKQQPADLIGRHAYDSQKEADTGTHMHVYTGYGPDAVHLKPFMGRVTAVNPGLITQVKISSHSTTLNNPPSEGRGFAEQDYRASLMVSLYRHFGSPGLSWMMSGEDSQRVGTLLDAVSRHGAGEMKDMILRDPAIYENVWVSAAPETAGAGNLFFGGLADYLVGGKGWDWAAPVGESAWAQLRKQSKLWSDYVVTTRNYNEDALLGSHPLVDRIALGTDEDRGRIADRRGPVPARFARGLGRALPLPQPRAEALLDRVHAAS